MVKLRTVSILILIAGALIGFFVFSTEANPESDFRLHYGLDLSGGTHLVYRADVSSLSGSDVEEAMRALRDVIERRVNAFGVSEPLVQVESGGFGSDEERLIVELPGVTDVEEAVAQIGETPLLEFRLLNPDADPSDFTSSTSTASTSDLYIDTGLTGQYLERAQLQFAGAQGGISNEPIVTLDFNSEGSDLFAQITRENIGEVLAIFLDGEPISAPVIQQEITGGTAQISGGFTPDEAQELARNLNLGALPVPIELISTQSVGPSLGHDVRDAGVYAGIIGLIAIAVFLILWYRLSGVIAVVSLAIYLLIMLTLFKLIPVVLTAAGIAGFILSIGMAVDANIIIFERMKEEFGRHGGDMQAAIKEGFTRAWPSIRDGNISSILTAIILYWAGTSLTKGFAVTFGIGVVMSMITAISISRTFLLAVAGERYEGVKKKLYGIGLSDLFGRESLAERNVKK